MSWKIIGVAATLIGLLAAVITLYDKFIIPIPDHEIVLVDDFKNEIKFDYNNTSFDSSFLIANKIIIDGYNITVPNKGLLIANIIEMKNGAAIYGDDFYILSTKIIGGKISSTGSRGVNGGDIFIISAHIDGTEIVSNGKNGIDGRSGQDGSRGFNGKDGRDGSCGAGIFGDWRSPERGQDGGNGGNGENGHDGENGGDAGKITVLVSNDLSMPAVSKGGLGGRGGQGGAAGRGGKGGAGGRGCSGLGGSVTTHSSGKDGIDGKPGKSGKNGLRGKTNDPTVKMISFHQVKKIFRENRNDRQRLIEQLLLIEPKN